MKQPKNPVGWFEIPVTDMDRAVKFYSHILEADLSKNIMEMGEELMCWLPWQEGEPGASGALVKHELYAPSDFAGVLIYLSSEDVTASLALVKEAGGKEVIAKKLITEDIGYMGAFIDSEGNRIALHSRK